jgi:hypothetical protein
VSGLSTAPQDRPARGTGPVLSTLAGLVAAFGVASCCGVAFMLATLGLGTARLGGFALLAARSCRLFPKALRCQLPSGGKHCGPIRTTI